MTQGMLTGEDVVEIVALHRRGWSGSAIVRHTGLARKAVRAWLAGERDRESRRRPSPLEPFRAIVQRFGDDPLDRRHQLRRGEERDDWTARAAGEAVGGAFDERGPVTGIQRIGHLPWNRK